MVTSEGIANKGYVMGLENKDSFGHDELEVPIRHLRGAQEKGSY